MSERKKGIYDKYVVYRKDGKERHYGCPYFVLDMEHDPFAVPALKAYAKACRADGYEKLADDLDAYVEMKADE